MPPNPHRVAVRDARRNDREINRLYGSYIGSARHPRGRIRSAYRQARLALSAAYRANTHRQTAEGLDVLHELRASLVMIGNTAIAEAVTIGVDSGQRPGCERVDHGPGDHRDGGRHLGPAGGVV